MTEPPSVSVILPTYDRTDVLGRAIESVLSQSYSDFELIVVDSSGDETQAIVEGFDDDRIIYLYQEPAGLGAARNLGIEKAQAEFIALQDDDDVWHPEKLATQMEAFERAPEEVGVVYSTVRKIRGDDRWFVPGESFEPTDGDVQRALWRQNFVSPQTAVVRKACFEAVGGFDERLPALEDWEMWLRISREFEFRHVDEPLVDAYISPDSLSTDHESVAESRDAIVRKHWETFDDRARARHLFWSGHGLVKAGQTNRGRGNLLSATTTNPRPLYLALFLLSLLGSSGYRKFYALFKSHLRPVFSVDS